MLYMTYLTACSHFVYGQEVTVAYGQEVIKKTSISAWSSSILSRQSLRKLSVISVTWTSAIYKAGSI